MYFEGRELVSPAESIGSRELREGGVYYAITYIDDEMLQPNIESLVFIGKDLEPGDVGQAYFQDLSSYSEGVGYDWQRADGPTRFYSGPENELNHIFTYEKMLNELMKCSLRRRSSNKEKGT
jgi:hypothetical protein